jgi:hypothetical protein
VEEEITMNCMYKLCNEPDMTKYLKINRLRRAGHIVRMENSRSVKKAFDARPEGTRKIERPKLRWEDGVIQDIRQGGRALGARNWRNVAMKREGYRSVGRAWTGFSWLRIGTSGWLIWTR